MIELINQNPLLIFSLTHLLMVSFEALSLFFKKRRVCYGEYIDKFHVVILSATILLLLTGYNNLTNILF